jgi:hypothetical protein
MNGKRPDTSATTPGKWWNNLFAIGKILQLQHASLEDSEGIVTAERRVWAQKPLS